MNVLTLTKHRSAPSVRHKRRPDGSANALLTEPRQFCQAQLHRSSRAQWFWTGFRSPPPGCCSAPAALSFLFTAAGRRLFSPFPLTDTFSMFTVNNATLADVNRRRKQPTHKCGFGTVAQQVLHGAAPSSVRSPGLCSPQSWISKTAHLKCNRVTVTTSGSHLLLQSLQ